IYALAGKEFNINSFKQLGEVLFEDLNLPVIKKTKTGFSTDNNVLLELIEHHPIIEKIIEYRSYTKLLSTYLLPMPSYILSDHRIHTIYNQCLTATGRLSSKEPNLQNIATRSPMQKSIKKMFVAKEGYELVSFDYSQIELRVLASFSNDPVFINAFKNDEDIHTVTAAKAFNIPLQEVSEQQRKAAKAINFGIVYGISDFGLALQLKIPRHEAKEFIDLYYQTYPSIKAYLDSLVTTCLEQGYCLTILKRRRIINEITSNNYSIRENGKRMAMNTPIQGSAADILKLAMIDVNNYLITQKIDAKMLLQVHDELIFEVKKELVPSFIKEVQMLMEKTYPLNVALKTNASHGLSWFDL
ncbi:MAG: DNA polymerase, partial [Bacilli bacterium]